MIDPIFKVEIEDGRDYTLGKTTYSIDSLRTWFLVKREFVDPMTNLMLKGEQLGRLVDGMKKVDFFPGVDISKVACYRVYCVFEKYNFYKDARIEIERKREELLEKVREKEERLLVSNRRKNGGRMVERLMEQIEKLNNRVCKLEEKLEKMEYKFLENMRLLLGSVRLEVKVI